MKLKKVALALSQLIDLFDYWRPSGRILPGKFFQASVFLTHELTISDYDTDFGKELVLFMASYRNKIRKAVWSFKFFLPAIMLIYLNFNLIYDEIYFELIVPFLESISPYFWGIIEIPLSIMILLLGILISLFIPAKISMNNLGRKEESEIKPHIQTTINYAQKFFKENDIDPKDFPIKVAYNDYQGLIYKKRRGIGYLAYVNVEESGS